jgi:TPP-dependent pyruvate/acetoin dehydrogenase alpha subunit
MIFAETFRMGGHATHDEKEARDLFPPEVFSYWGQRDPIGMYEVYLERHGVSQSKLNQVEQQVLAEVADAEKDALESRKDHMPAAKSLTEDVYAVQDSALTETSSAPARPRAGNIRKMPSR